MDKKQQDQLKKRARLWRTRIALCALYVVYLRPFGQGENGSAAGTQ